MRIGNRNFDTKNNTYIMGILNATPDSFSDGGKFNTVDKALYHVSEMIRAGASIIDIGGESTRPGHKQIPDQEEIERVLPMIEAVKANFDVPVSLDTYKSEVAMAGIKAGADMINDIWGLKYDEKLAKTIADNHVACCLMHNRDSKEYDALVPEIKTELQESVDLALAAGITKEKIMIDPGIGFGKTYEQNLVVLNALDQFCEMGYPVLLGTSRKSVIRLTLDTNATDSVAGTVATTALGVLAGCAFIRVHDVKENMDAVRMIQAIKRSEME
ncbi:MAG: dihydropteroate synthase [Eubacterium sp.]|nr:dihydropteroate synthase [Eubacterium sp.]